MCARHCFLPSMMSWMPTSASSLTQFPCDVPVQLAAPPVAIAPAPCSAGHCRAETLDVVPEHLVNALPVRRCFLEQPQNSVENRHQIAAREARVRDEVNLDLLPRPLVVGRQPLGPGLERRPFPGEI